MATPAAGAAARFVWHELMTPDAAAAARFYSAVLGWTTTVESMHQGDYILGAAGGTQVVGMMDLTPDAVAAGAPAGWMGYVAVADVDAKAAEAEAAGGRICHPAFDIPGVGRFATVADRDGVPICLFKGSGSDEAPVSDPDAPGNIGWNELVTEDLDAAWAFHGGLFGWVKGEAIDMGPMGTYQLFSAAPGLPPMGGMMRRPPEVPRPGWLTYFNVAALDAATDRVRGAGGQVINAPMQVPGGSWVVSCIDPQGVAFALVGPQR
jgi:hypothetical protein